MNLPTALLVVLLLIVVALAIRNMIKRRKIGGCSGCPGAGSCNKNSCT